MAAALAQAREQPIDAGQVPASGSRRHGQVFLDAQRVEDLALLRHPAQAERRAAVARHADQSSPRQHIVPCRTRVCPITVSSSVLLPAPLRPSSASVSPSPSAKLHSSSTMPSPYPAQRRSSTNSWGHGGSPGTPRARARRRRSAPGCCDEFRAADHHRDPLREAEDQRHAVLDQQHADVARQLRDHAEQFLGVPWHARRGLIEQQHLRSDGERERHLQQPLLAVGELAGRPQAFRAQVHALQQQVGLVDLAAAARQPEEAPLEHAEPVAVPFADRVGHRFQRRELREQRVDLERARQPTPHALVRTHAGDPRLRARWSRRTSAARR